MSRIVRQELVDTFKKDFPHMDMSSAVGMFCFQGYVAGYRRANTHRDTKIKEMNTKFEEKERIIEQLENHIKMMGSYIKGTKNEIDNG